MLCTARRWGLSPPAFEALPRGTQIELMALEQERTDLREALLRRWPEGDVSRNLAVALYALDAW